MHNKLVELYLKGISQGWISYTESEMRLTEAAPVEYSVNLIDLEAVVYQRDRLLSTRQTRRLAEFKRAVELSKTPLLGALK